MIFPYYELFSITSETPFECPNNEPGYYPLKPGKRFDQTI